MSENHSLEQATRTPQELAAAHDRARARVLAREAHAQAQALGRPYARPWVAEGVQFDHMVDAVGYAALSLRRSHLRYAWILDLSGERPGVWCLSVRGLEFAGDA